MIESHPIPARPVETLPIAITGPAMTEHRSSARQYSFLDNLLIQADTAIRAIAGASPAPLRPSPAHTIELADLGESQSRHVAGLMRINHAGEVCAQALYQGQALTARNSAVRDKMQQSAAEELDHLAWCEQRLEQLDSHVSVLNPLWYAMSFAIGAGAGLVGDRVSLGFVAATEDQVCEHLQQHLQQLPEVDEASRAILTQMLSDEADHAHKAIDAGGLRFPAPIKWGMTLVSKVMTKAAYYV
jgi:ubiquinone biosynthesis monooxygenase Coq7